MCGDTVKAARGLWAGCSISPSKARLSTLLLSGAASADQNPPLVDQRGGGLALGLWGMREMGGEWKRMRGGE